MNKNFLIIIASLGGGGAEKVATLIGSKFNVHQNVFYLTWYSDESEYDYSGNKICLNEEKTKNYIIHFYRLLKRAYIIKRLSQQYRIDYCISFMEESNFPNILSKFIFRNKAKIIVSVRNSVESMTFLTKKLIKLLYNKADIVIPNSYEEATNLINKYGIKSPKVTTIYNPIDSKKIRILSKSVDIPEKLFSKKVFTFITVGRAVKQKNQIFIIKCFQKFLKKHPNTQLIIIGEGPLKKTLEELSNDKKIKILGYQKNVYKYLSRSDCFLFSSLHEGFPNAVLEAMACGLPIISTEFKTGIKEIIEDNKYGIIVDQGDEDKYIKAMEKIYINGEILKYYQNNSLLRCKKYEIDKIVNERINALQ